MDCRALQCRITGDRTGQSKRHGVGWAGPVSARGPRALARVHICIGDASRIAVTGTKHGCVRKATARPCFPALFTATQLMPGRKAAAAMAAASAKPFFRRFTKGCTS